ncbi:MAG TPA: nucleoside triphosphate pyrophosphohydrolase [Firmicutes bacterium]|nr:nucleoside triphosphate pyrophosphohydrolase [Bacillota bacterium]
MKSEKKNNFAELVRIMEKLRAKDGCPWDKKQNHRTLLPYILEESYEVIEAVNKEDYENLKEELGDLLLQVVFHAEIARGKSRFDIYDVVETLNKKLISRHPHVFAGKKGLRKAGQVRDFWEEEKKKTKKWDSVLDGVPKALPALLRARRLQSKAGGKGFKWLSSRSVENKIKEEYREILEAVKNGNKKRIEEEIGDFLFAAAALSYFHGVNPENALQRANDKFISRFAKIEKRLNNRMEEKEILELWSRAKEGAKRGKRKTAGNAGKDGPAKLKVKRCRNKNLKK